MHRLCPVTENLHLDMAGLAHKLLNQHVVIAERRSCFCFRTVQCGSKIGGIFDKPQKLYMDDIDFTDIEISKFSTNSPFAAALDKAGKVYSWGSNTLGQLGHGDQRVRKLPTQIQSLKRKTITQMSIGHNFVVMLGRDVSQEEQQKKKLKRKMQKEAKEKERQ